MDHTEQQKTEFKEQFAARRRRQILLGVPLALFVVSLALFGEDKANHTLMGLPSAVAGPLVLALVVGALVFSWRNWRCPACDRYLGKGVSPAFCPKCGVALQ